MAKSPLTRLAPRDREVLELIAQGKTNAEIASALSIRFDTARWHVSEVLSKLGVASREEAATVFHAEQQPRSRLRRSFAGIPALIAVGSVSAVAVVGVVLLVSFAMGNDDPAEALQPLVAYTEQNESNRNLLDQEPAALHVINAHTHHETEIGPPAHYLAVKWAPGAERLFALAVERAPPPAVRTYVPMLIEYPGGAVKRLDFQQSHGPPSSSDGAWWSPDGSRLVLRWGDHLLLCKPDGQLIRELIPGTTESAPTGPAAWSPDGERVAARFGDHAVIFDRAGSQVFAIESGAGWLFWLDEDRVIVVGAIAETYTVVDLGSDQPTVKAGDDPDLVYDHFAQPHPATEGYRSELRGRGEDPLPMELQATDGYLFRLDMEIQLGNERRPRKIGIGVDGSVFIVHIHVRWRIPSFGGDRIDVVLQP